MLVIFGPCIICLFYVMVFKTALRSSPSGGTNRMERHIERHRVER